MVKQFQEFLALFSKLAALSRLNRLKIFYQILIIILIMIICLSIQSFVNVRIIDTLQSTTQNIFVDNSHQTTDIARLKQNLAKLEVAYLNSILNKASSTNNQAVANMLIAFDWMDETSKKDISVKLDAIKELVKTAPNIDNYNLLRAKLFDTTLSITNIEMKLSSATGDGITRNNRFLDDSKRNGIIILIVSSLFSLLIGLIIVNSISQPLQKIEAAAESIARGDLTQNIVTSGSPEITRVVSGLNRAIDGLRELIKNVISQSAMINNASKDLKNASSETGKSASEVAQAMEELSEGSAKEAEQISQAADTVQFLSKLVQQVSNDTEAISSASEKVAQTTKAGLQATVDVADEIQELYLSTKETAGVINELSKASDEISEIISVIGGIAEQTTLLALNASIEAARAGEHGRGFAVVAQETGKLADQSKQAAGLIVSLIANIKQRTDEAVTTMQKGMIRAENGKNLTTQTSETFKEIFKSLNDNLAQIEAVAQSARKMFQSNKVVIEAINEIAAISQETIASTEEVSATAEEQSASTQQVAALADSLSQIANKLNQAIAAFELN